MPPSDTINPNLWDIARKQLTTAEEAQLAKAVVDNNNLTEQLLELVQEKKQQCMDRRWKFKRSNGDVIVIRDVFEKVVRWIQKFIAVGDVAIQYDPVHAALPWAGVRMLLQVAVNDTETLAAVAEGIEMISYHIGRCAVYERLYLVPHNLPVRTERTLLQNALISFYASILEWLSKAGVYYAMSTRRRSLSAVVSPTPTLAEITKQEQRITQLTTSLQDQLISDMSGVLYSLDASFHDLMKLLREFEQPIVRIIGTLGLIESNIKAEEQTRLATWLSKVRHDYVHKQVHHLVPNTGQWLLQRKEYIEWRDSSHSSCLWLKGVPGCGKSKLSSLVIQEHLDCASRNQNAAPVAFCYCSRSGIDGSPPSPMTIMGSVLKQLAFLGPSGGVHHSIWEEFSDRVKNAQGLEPSPLSLVDCQELVILITADCPVTIIIDGLDEAEGEIRDLLDTFQHIVEESQNIVKLFLSCRDYTPVVTHLQNVTSIHITEGDNGNDVSTFVQTKVGAAVKSKRLLGGKGSRELEARVIQTLTQGSGVMFLWASLNLEYLCGSEFEEEEDVMDELKELLAPESLLQTLEQMYQRVQRYKARARQITNTVFGWLLISERQLSNSELLDLVKLRMNLRMGEIEEENIKNLCRGFVNSENDSDSFAFAHESIREFLQRKDEFRPSKLHFVAFSLCLRCLAERYDDFDGLQAGPSRRTQTTDSESLQLFIDSPADHGQHSFWRYAVFYWLRHYTKISAQNHLAEADPKLLQFVFESRGFRSLAWQREMLSLLEEVRGEEYFQKNIVLLRELTSMDTNHQLGIFIASVYGIPIILGKLQLENPQLNWEEKNNHGASGLYLSSVCGHDGILRHLLRHGVDPNVTGGRFKTPIQGAAVRGHHNIVEILLRNGADPLMEGIFPTALHAAIAGGSEPVIQLLIDNNLCHQAAQLGSLIQAGFNYGRYETVDALLRNYFDNEVKLKEIQDESIMGIVVVLQAALYGTKNNIEDNTENETKNHARIRELLERMSDINEPGGLFGNALQAASLAGSALWVRVLLERGADPNSIGYCGSALRAASFGGHNEVVYLLLEHGATLGPGKQDALEACALRDRLYTLKLLVKHFSLAKASDYLDNKRYFSMTMRTAWRLHRTRIINFLVEIGAGSLSGDGLDDPFSDEQQQNRLDFVGSSNEDTSMLDEYLKDTGNVQHMLLNPPPPPPPESEK